MSHSFLSPRLAATAVSLVFALLALFAIAVVVSMIAGQAPLARLIMFFMPLPFYLAALWFARGAIARIGKGEALRGLISPMLARIGWALFLGGLTEVFLVPWLQKLLMEHGAYGNFDVNAITLGAVGVTLVVIARLVEEAERDRAELDEIF